MGVVHQPLPSFVYDVSNKIFWVIIRNLLSGQQLYLDTFLRSHFDGILIGPNFALDPNLKRGFT
jgi:hypothetical protein